MMAGSTRRLDHAWHEGGEPTEGRDRPRRCLADPRRRQLGEPGRPPRRGGGGGQPRTTRRRNGARARPASTRRSAPPIPTRRWRPPGATGGSSRPSSSTPRSTMQSGVVLDVTITTGEVNEGQVLEARSTRSRRRPARAIVTVTADAGYAYGKIYGGLERRGIEARDPGQGGADPQPGAAAPVPLRCPARHRQMSSAVERCVRSGRSSTAGSSTPAPGTARAVRCAGSACRRVGSTRRS